MEMNCAELVVKDAIAKYFPGERLMTIGRTAILTQRHRGRAPCHYCGPCARGCITRSYFSSLNSTLPAALTTGKVTVRPHSVVHSLMFDSQNTESQRSADHRRANPQTPSNFAAGSCSCARRPWSRRAFC